MPQPMITEQADAVYDVLVEHCGASPDGRGDFVAVETASVVLEYRFQGALGFGGKFRRSGFDDHWYVDCYEEDLTDGRWRMINAANDALDALRAAAA